MSQLQFLKQQIEDSIVRLDASPIFGAHLWLTFYLSGQGENLSKVAAALGEAGWTNLDGSDAGFIYPKTRVRKNAAEIVELAVAVDELCSRFSSTILNIDADTSSDSGSKFVTLFCA